jgi:hypothetical protein
MEDDQSKWFFEPPPSVVEGGEETYGEIKTHKDRFIVNLKKMYPDEVTGLPKELIIDKLTEKQKDDIIRKNTKKVQEFMKSITGKK